MLAPESHVAALFPRCPPRVNHFVPAATTAMVNRLVTAWLGFAPMLVEPSSSPSPINVNVTVSMPPINIPPDTALDTYTGGYRPSNLGASTWQHQFRQVVAA